MATTTEAQHRAVGVLDSVGRMLADLPEVARTWERLSDGEQMGWSLDWSNEMSKLVHLCDDASRGLLTSDQRQRCTQLAGRLADLAPALHRLDLYYPPELPRDGRR